MTNVRLRGMAMWMEHQLKSFCNAFLNDINFVLLSHLLRNVTVIFKIFTKKKFDSERMKIKSIKYEMWYEALYLLLRNFLLKFHIQENKSQRNPIMLYVFTVIYINPLCSISKFNHWSPYTILPALKYHMATFAKTFTCSI